MKKIVKKPTAYRKIPCVLSELISDALFVEISRLLRSIASDAERYTAARAVMVKNRMIKLVPHGFLSSRPYVQLASCFSREGQVNILSDGVELLNIGFWMDQSGDEICSLGENEFHVVWSPVNWTELLRPSYEVFVGSYEHRVMSLEQVFACNLVVLDGTTINLKSEHLLRLKV